MSKTLEVTEYRPEQWLLCSPSVTDRLLKRPSLPGSLFGLRINERLVREANWDQIEYEVHTEITRGQTCLHLVFGRLTEEIVRRIRPLVREGVELRLHDWYDSPSAVIDSLACPDASLLAALRRRLQEPSAPALKLAQVPRLPADFQDRLVAGLQRWERESREDFEEDFADVFGAAPIHWHGLLPPAAASVAAAPAAAGPTIAGWVADRAARFTGVLRGVGQSIRSPLVPLGGSPLAAHAAAGDALGTSLLWEIPCAGSLLTVRVVLTELGGPKVYLVFLSPATPPKKVILSYASPHSGIWRFQLEPTWVEQEGQAQRSSGQKFRDETEALRRWLILLKAKNVQVQAEPVFEAEEAAGPAQQPAVQADEATTAPPGPTNWQLEGEGRVLRVQVSQAGAACRFELELDGPAESQPEGLVLRFLPDDNRPWSLSMAVPAQTIADPTGALMAWLSHLKATHAAIEAHPQAEADEDDAS